MVDGIGDIYAVMSDKNRKPVGWKLEEGRWFFPPDCAIVRSMDQEAAEAVAQAVFGLKP